jgi:hypothetical protein
MMKKGIGLLQPLHQHQQQVYRQHQELKEEQQQQEEEQKLELQRRQKQQQQPVAVWRLHCAEGRSTRIQLPLAAALTYIVAVQVMDDV